MYLRDPAFNRVNYEKTRALKVLAVSTGKGAKTVLSLNILFCLKYL